MFKSKQLAFTGNATSAQLSVARVGDTEIQYELEVGTSSWYIRAIYQDKELAEKDFNSVKRYMAKAQKAGE